MLYVVFQTWRERAKQYIARGPRVRTASAGPLIHINDPPLHEPQND
jgi:hypothetical protein